jgi:hypothetical protein
MEGNREIGVLGNVADQLGKCFEEYYMSIVADTHQYALIAISTICSRHTRRPLRPLVPPYPLTSPSLPSRRGRVMVEVVKVSAT